MRSYDTPGERQLAGDHQFRTDLSTGTFLSGIYNHKSLPL